ncbi:MAG: hypothetical protein VXZ53_04345, partial [Planctomycetota bacterium]|nr:hypothetical protein [Planctomycetota bacterium]
LMGSNRLLKKLLNREFHLLLLYADLTMLLARPLKRDDVSISPEYSMWSSTGRFWELDSLSLEIKETRSFSTRGILSRRVSRLCSSR